MTTDLSSLTPQPGLYNSIEEYLRVRNELFQAEHGQSLYSTATENSLEWEAEKIVSDIKNWEEKNLHGIQADGSGCEAGHRFLSGLSTVAKSKILEITKMAPKGALLHCHFDAMLPPDTILRDARNQQNLYVKSDVPLSSPGLFTHALPQFTVMRQEDAPQLTDTTNLFSKNYIAGSWMSYFKFLELFPGGQQRAEQWLSQKMLLSSEDAYHHKQTVDGIWQLFIRAVIISRSLLCYETAYSGQFRRVLWKFAEDGLSYAEIRLALNYQYTISSDDGQTHYDVGQIVEMLKRVQAEELPRIRAKGYHFIGVKFIYTCMRLNTKEAMQWCMNKCIELKQLFPDLICGFDMAGQEDTGYTLRHWVPEILAMRAKCNELNLDIPFIFHAGETLNHGSDCDSNLYDAILLGTKRIGHGFSITRHPMLMKLCRERGIAIETCPISNDVLGLCASAKTHHLPVLLANCVPACVNSDDPGSWGASMLSHDLQQVLVSSNKMTLSGLRVLVECSIQHSCLDAETKGKELQLLKKRWIEFCQWIIDTYGNQ